MRFFVGVIVCLAITSSCPGQEGDLNAVRRQQQLVSQERPADGDAWWHLAIQYQNLARYKDSERSYSRAISLLAQQRPAAVADVMDDMGTMYAQERKFLRAQRVELDALRLREERGDSVGVGLSWMHLAMASLGMHDLSNASTLAEMAVARLVMKEQNRVDGQEASSEEKMTALIYLSHVRCAQKEFSAAEESLTRARELAVASNSNHGLEVAYIDYLLGYAHWKAGDIQVARSQMQAGLGGMRPGLGWGHPTYVDALKQYRAFLVQHPMSEQTNEQALSPATNGSAGPTSSSAFSRRPEE